MLELFLQTNETETSEIINYSNAESLKMSAIETGQISSEPGKSNMSQHHFKLYVMGSSARSSQAIDNLRRFCEEFMPSEYQLTIIDVLENPKAAELDKIFATPTLIKHQPPPVKRLVGDLTDREQVSRMLDIAKSRVKQ